MLYIFSESIAQALENDENSEIINKAIEKIVFSKIEGKHTYFGHKKVLEKIIDFGKFSHRTMANLRSLYNGYSQMGYLTSIKTYIVIENGKENISRTISDDKYIVSITPDILVKSYLLDRPILLCENIRDCYFYKSVAEVYMVNNNLLKVFKLSFEAINGGGNNIKDQYNYYQVENNKLCFCILDCDYKYKGDSEKPTASNLIRVDHRNNSNGKISPFCTYSLLTYHEIENLIPSELLFDIINGNENRKEFVDFYFNLERNNNNARFYIDIKNGFILKDILLSQNPDCNKYWQMNLRSYINSCNYMHKSNCEDECVCFSIPGMGDNVLDNILDNLILITPHKLREKICNIDNLFDEWLRVGELIFYWCIAEKVSYT